MSNKSKEAINPIENEGLSRIADSISATVAKEITWRLRNNLSSAEASTYDHTLTGRRIVLSISHQISQEELAQFSDFTPTLKTDLIAKVKERVSSQFGSLLHPELLISIMDIKAKNLGIELNIDISYQYSEQAIALVTKWITSKKIQIPLSNFSLPTVPTELADLMKDLTTILLENSEAFLSKHKVLLLRDSLEVNSDSVELGGDKKHEYSLTPSLVLDLLKLTNSFQAYFSESIPDDPATSTLDLQMIMQQNAQALIQEIRVHSKEVLIGKDARESLQSLAPILAVILFALFKTLGNSEGADFGKVFSEIYPFILICWVLMGFVRIATLSHTEESDNQ